MTEELHIHMFLTVWTPFLFVEMEWLPVLPVGTKEVQMSDYGKTEKFTVFLMNLELEVGDETPEKLLYLTTNMCTN